MNHLNNLHAIRKQILDLHFSSENRVPEIKQRIAQLNRNKIMPLLANIFDQYNNSTVIQHIEKVQLDIGTVHVSQLEQEFLEKIEIAFEKAMQEKLAHSVDSTFLVSPEVNHTHRLFDFFIHFIQTGAFPWWMKNNAIHLDQCLQILIQELPKETVNAIKEYIQYPLYVQRLIWQCSDKILLELIYLISTKLGEFLKNHHDTILVTLKTGDVFQKFSQKILRTTYWHAIFLNLHFFLENGFIEFVWVKKILLHVSVQHQITYLDVLKNAIAASKKMTFLQEKDSSWLVLLEQLYTEATNTLNSQQHYNVKNDNPGKNFDLDKINIYPENNLHHFYDGYFSDRADENHDLKAKFNLDAFYIDNAGLVLLASFLPIFFDANLLLQNGQFKNQVAAHRAVLLLQYLIMPTEFIPEQYLTLNKILCGLDLFEPVEQHFDITLQEQQECVHLLEVVLKQWPGMNRMSVNYFVDYFLNRAGVLKEQGDCWFLQVETTSHDILMEQRPWSISSIKLPWMIKPLLVGW